MWLEIAVGMLLVKAVYDIWRDAQRDKRTSSLEWLQTVPLDERIAARRRQIAFEESERLRKLREKAPTSRPLPADPWAHNGQNG